MKPPASIVICDAPRELRKELANRLAPLAIRFAESTAGLLERAKSEPTVVILVQTGEAEPKNFDNFVTELRSHLPDSSWLLLSDAAPGPSECDAVLDPRCSDAELAQTCGLLTRIAELRRSLADTAVALEQAIQHQDALAESHRQQIARLTEAALTDGLTGIPNRRHLERRLEDLFTEAVRDGHPLSVAVFDLDHFKSINEQFGHEAGDVVLRAAADAFRAGLREHDFIGRLGGDEFMALLPNLDPDDLRRVAERLLEGVASRRIDYEGQTIRVEASAGLCTYPEDRAARPAEVLRHADLAMLEAKRRGRNRICVWSPALGGPE